MVAPPAGPRTLYFLVYASYASWMPLFNVYLQQRGLSGLQIGLLAGLSPAWMFASFLLRKKPAVPADPPPITVGLGG